MDELTDKELQELKQDLLNLREELETSLQASTDSAKPVELDQPIGRLSRMDAIQQQQMAKATRGMQQRRLEAVKRAFTAFRNEEYGECRVCGEYIGFQRLKVKPESARCRECQEERERR